MSSINFIPSLFLIITAHTCMVVTLFWNRNYYVKNSMAPDSDMDVDLFYDLDTSLSINLSLSSVFLLLELILLFRKVYSTPINVFLLFNHTFGIIILLKFILHYHPVHHFWIHFALFSVPTISIPVVQLFKDLSMKKLCY
uniref:Transmembrane protein 107 n=1 Tax=Strongyloides papillosus TaxID=174720 RepID=A0A0N5C899_STREA